MSRFLPVLSVLLVLWGAPSLQAQSLSEAVRVTSPDERVRVRLGLSDDGVPHYTVHYDGSVVLRTSPLGLGTSMGDWHRGLSVTDTSAATATDTWYLGGFNGEDEARMVRVPTDSLTLELDGRGGEVRRFDSVSE
jgi:hypothetical protein